jgi:hypothetical protein
MPSNPGLSAGPSPGFVSSHPPYTNNAVLAEPSDPPISFLPSIYIGVMPLSACPNMMPVNDA